MLLDRQLSFHFFILKSSTLDIRNTAELAVSETWQQNVSDKFFNLSYEETYNTNNSTIREDKGFS
jgi:hypothetical protein